MGIILENGYEMKTTFWQDFSIADVFGEDAIQDTYDRSFESFKTDVVYITELSLVLNWKIWYHYEKDSPLQNIYDTLWRKHHDWCLDNLKGDDLTYYIKTTD